MNSQERMKAVLEHRLPNRVPLGESWIDSTIVNALASGDWNDLAIALGLDVDTIPTMIYDDDELEWVDKEKRIFRDKWGACEIQPHEGVPIIRVSTPVAGLEGKRGHS